MPVPPLPLPRFRLSLFHRTLVAIHPPTLRLQAKYISYNNLSCERADKDLRTRVVVVDAYVPENDVHVFSFGGFSGGD